MVLHRAQGLLLVGTVSQADIAKNVSDPQTGDLVEDISAAPPNN